MEQTCCRHGAHPHNVFLAGRPAGPQRPNAQPTAHEHPHRCHLFHGHQGLAGRPDSPIPASPPGDRGTQVESVGGSTPPSVRRSARPLTWWLLASDAIEKPVAAGHLLAETRGHRAFGQAVAARRGNAARHLDRSALMPRCWPRPRSAIPPASARAAGAAVRALGHRCRNRAAHRHPAAGRTGGSLVAKGEVALGFQQLSELMNLPGITPPGRFAGGGADRHHFLRCADGCLKTQNRCDAQLSRLPGQWQRPPLSASTAWNPPENRCQLAVAGAPLAGTDSCCTHAEHRHRMKSALNFLMASKRRVRS